jgi:hypothetical protein
MLALLLFVVPFGHVFADSEEDCDCGNLGEDIEFDESEFEELSEESGLDFFERFNGFDKYNEVKDFSLGKGFNVENEFFGVDMGNDLVSVTYVDVLSEDSMGLFVNVLYVR